MSFLGGILSAVAGPIIGGVFNKKAASKNRAQGVEDTLLQLPRLRQSAEDAGFNPLTALLATGGQGFNNIPGGAAPLASSQVLSGAIQGVSDLFTEPDKAAEERQRVQDRIQELRLERLEAGDAGDVFARTAGVAGLGSRPAQSNAPDGYFPVGTALSPHRDIDVAEVQSIPGFYELDNAMTRWSGGRVYLPGDQLEGDLDNLIIGTALAVPQMARNKYESVAAKQPLLRDIIRSSWGFMIPKYEGGVTKPGYRWSAPKLAPKKKGKY